MPLVQGAFLIVIILFLVLFFYFVPVGMWVQAVVSLGLGRIRIVDLIRMRLRKISPRLVVDGVINTHKAGLDHICLLYTSPSPRDRTRSRMPSSA